MNDQILPAKLDAALEALRLIKFHAFPSSNGEQLGADINRARCQQAFGVACNALAELEQEAA